MPLFPSLTFEIESPLKTEEVLARLRNGIEPRRWLRFSHQHRTFEGVIAGNRFDVRRIIHERNAFLPRVSGEISTIVGGTCLTGTMRVHRFVAAFMVFWVAAGVFAFLVPFTNVGFHAAQLIPLAMAAFGIIAIRTVPGFAPRGPRSAAAAGRTC